MITHQQIQTAMLCWHGPVHALPPEPSWGRHSAQPMQHGFQYDDELMRAWRLIFELAELGQSFVTIPGHKVKQKPRSTT